MKYIVIREMDSVWSHCDTEEEAMASAEDGQKRFLSETFTIYRSTVYTQVDINVSFQKAGK